MEDTRTWIATMSRRQEELDTKDAEETTFITEDISNNKQEEEMSRMFGDGLRRLLKAKEKAKGREEVSKVIATIAESTDTPRAIAQSRRLAMPEETEEPGRVKAKEDSKALAGRAGKLATHGTAARREQVQKELGRVVGRVDGKAKTDGVGKEKEFPWRIIGLEFRLVWEDPWKESSLE